MSTLKEIAQNKLDAKFESGRVNAQNMIIKLQNELDQSRDFLAPFGRHEIGDGGIEFGSNGHLRMNFQGNSMTVHNHAVTQLGAKLGILRHISMVWQMETRRNVILPLIP